jgi:hypothetical protein
MDFKNRFMLVLVGHPALRQRMSMAALDASHSASSCAQTFATHA